MEILINDSNDPAVDVADLCLNCRVATVPVLEKMSGPCVLKFATCHDLEAIKCEGSSRKYAGFLMKSLATETHILIFDNSVVLLSFVDS